MRQHERFRIAQRCFGSPGDRSFAAKAWAGRGLPTPWVLALRVAIAESVGASPNAPAPASFAPALYG